ncbi:hypothetical protein Tco_0299152 [Tanacetum coccineum]
MDSMLSQASFSEAGLVLSSFSEALEKEFSTKGKGQEGWCVIGLSWQSDEVDLLNQVRYLDDLGFWGSAVKA